jgi:hypothetical protein
MPVNSMDVEPARLRAVFVKFVALAWGGCRLIDVARMLREEFFGEGELLVGPGRLQGLHR